MDHFKKILLLISITLSQTETSHASDTRLTSLACLGVMAALASPNEFKIYADHISRGEKVFSQQFDEKYITPLYISAVAATVHGAIKLAAAVRQITLPILVLRGAQGGAAGVIAASGVYMGYKIGVPDIYNKFRINHGSIEKLSAKNFLPGTFTPYGYIAGLGLHDVNLTFQERCDIVKSSEVLTNFYVGAIANIQIIKLAIKENGIDLVQGKNLSDFSLLADTKAGQPPTLFRMNTQSKQEAKKSAK